MTDSAGGVPAPLLIGPCVEVWADPNAKPDPCRAEGWPTVDALSSRRRHADARRAWLELAGITRTDEAVKVIPTTGSAWSATYMAANGRGDLVAARLTRAGCTITDLPALRAQAAELTKNGARR